MSGLVKRLSRLALCFFALLPLTLAIPEWPTLARHIRDSRAIKDTYDYIIVGGGTAGLTVADRLSEDGKFSVLVVEHGYFYNASNPRDLRPSRQYNISTIPQINLANKTVPIAIGHCVGGSSAINGMAVMRGTKEEYNIWAELGEAGSTWNWNGLLPYFRKAAHFVAPDKEVAEKFKVRYDIDAAWGQDNNTRLYASFPGGYDSRSLHIYEAFKQIPGVNVSRDGHSGEHGLFYYPVSVDPATRRRSYSRTAHWDNLNRTNYDIITGSKVTKIQFYHNIAQGVEFVPKEIFNGTEAQVTTIKARKEVILAAGAIHTPQILQLSGIGPADLLKQANITVRSDLPGVGSNFQDHPLGPGVFFRCKSGDPSLKCTLMRYRGESNHHHYSISHGHVVVRAEAKGLVPFSLYQSFLQTISTKWRRDTNPMIWPKYIPLVQLIPCLRDMNGNARYLRGR